MKYRLIQFVPLAVSAWFLAVGSLMAEGDSVEHGDHTGHDHDAHDHEDHSGHDHSAHDHDDCASNEGAVDWLSGDGVNIGGFLFPEIFGLAAFGDSTADPADLAVHDHDPQRNATLQSLDFSAILDLGRLTGSGTFVLSTDAGGRLNSNLEEAFLHYEFVDGLKIGGGQFFNSFGFQNERHPHAWDFVDQHLVNGRMLNEGELTTIGGEVIVDLPTSWQSTLTVGGGGLANHGHSGGESHGHGHGESEFDADGANFDAWVLSGNYRAEYGGSEAMAGTASFAVGENGFGEISQVYGIGHEILWNGHTDPDPQSVIADAHGHGFNGFSAGSLRWRTEAMFRTFKAISSGEEDDGHHEEEHHEEEHHEEATRRATLDEFGIYTMLQYGLCDWASAGIRAEWISGIDQMGLDERWRLSPAITTYLNNRKTVQARLQYNYDHGSSFGSEHSIWLQIGVLWGGAPGGHGHEH